MEGTNDKRINFNFRISDVGESLNGAAFSVKEAVMGTVKSIENGIDDFASNVEHKIDEKFKINKTDDAMQYDENGEPLCRTIPLKDPKSISFDEMDEFKDMLSKMTQDQSENLKDHSVTVENAMNAVDELGKDVKNKLIDSVQELEEKEMNDKTPTHSLDSLKTSTPEPEIINAILNDTTKSAPSPKPTLKEMKSIEEMDEVLNVVMDEVLDKNNLRILSET